MRKFIIIHHCFAGGLNYNRKRILLKKTTQNAEKTVVCCGLLIAEMPPDKKEDPSNLLKSSRIQAELTYGLILIQSSLDGGSRFTTKSFSETHRPIAIINPIQSDFYPVDIIKKWHHIPRNDWHYITGIFIKARLKCFF